MFEALKQQFIRYFFLNPSRANSAITLPSGILRMFSGRRDNRRELSEIIKDRVYLSDLPDRPLDSNEIKLPDEPEKALIVSCLDIGELAKSKLLLELDPQFKYHVLPLEDVSAKPGCIEQIIETILLMSRFGDANKPIQIHCFSGVGRSAMITAIYIAYRYMQGDVLIQECLNRSSKYLLDPNNEDFIEQLYKSACNFVFERRNCCQFDEPSRHDWAVAVLNRLKGNYQPISDKNYLFLADLVQSPAFKKFQYLYFARFNSIANDALLLQKQTRDFFDSLIMNKDGWFKQLISATTNDETSPEGQLSAFCQNKSLSYLLTNLLQELDSLAARHPESLYSQHIKNAATHHNDIQSEARDPLKLEVF